MGGVLKMQKSIGEYFDALNENIAPGKSFLYCGIPKNQ
jgi:hypothetical protein